MLVESFNGFGTSAFNLGTRIFNVTSALNNIIDFCEYDESLYDFLTYCYEYEEACDPSNMMQTLMKKIFQVTTVANDFAAMMNEGLPTEKTPLPKVEEFWDRFGSNLGKLLRYATEFDPKLLIIG